MSEWQPIETAPKGTAVLVYQPAWGGFIAVCFRNGWRTPEGYYRQPTHWMPIPAAPENDEGQSA